VETQAGTFTFEVIDGTIYLTDYDLNWGWGANTYYQWNGDLVVSLYRGWYGHQTIKAWLDGDGNLQVSVW
jgi:hypothetical protein